VRSRLWRGRSSATFAFTHRFRDTGGRSRASRARCCRSLATTLAGKTPIDAPTLTLDGVSRSDQTGPSWSKSCRSSRIRELVQDELHRSRFYADRAGRPERTELRYLARPTRTLAPTRATAIRSRADRTVSTTSSSAILDRDLTLRSRPRWKALEFSSMLRSEAIASGPLHSRLGLKRLVYFCLLLFVLGDHSMRVIWLKRVVATSRDYSRP